MLMGCTVVNVEKKTRRVGATHSGVARVGAAKLGFYLKNRKGKSIPRSREGYNRALGERKIGRTK